MYQLFAQKTMKNTPRGASRQGARSPREWCLASLTLSFAFANIVTLKERRPHFYVAFQIIGKYLFLINCYISNSYTISREYDDL